MPMSSSFPQNRRTQALWETFVRIGTLGDGAFPRRTNGRKLVSEQVDYWLANPDAGLAELDRLDAEDSFAEFSRQAWSYADPAKYVHNWHIDVIAEHLEDVLAGRIRRLLINMPPRHMKSSGVSVHLAPDAWIDRPELQFLYMSYAANLSIRDSVKCRRVIERRCPGRC